MIITRPKSKQPIPDKAKLVFKGVVFEVWQWEQEMFDGSVTTFEKLKRPDVVNVIPVTTDKKIIVTKQSQPGLVEYFGSPGGRVDEGEDILNAAKRELREETGYESNNWELWDAVQPADKIEFAEFTFLAFGAEKAGEPSPEVGEKIELVYLGVREYLELVKKESFRDTVITLKLARMDAPELDQFTSRIEKHEN